MVVGDEIGKMSLLNMLRSLSLKSDGLGCTAESGLSKALIFGAWVLILISFSSDLLGEVFMLENLNRSIKLRETKVGQL